MRDEIEAAALFITRLVNKNLSNACSASSSIHHSHSSSASSSLSSSSSSSTSSASSSSSTSSDSPPDFDEQNPTVAPSSATIATPTTTTSPTTTTTTGGDQDKVVQFRQCLEEALYERFHNHWFPEQPTKGQAYRCIRLNEWDRRDITLQKVCTQCGIDYKDLQLPVELTLWVDPDEVTCRFGENKGSHCLVAKFKDGELKDNNINLDINNIDIEIFRQAANEGMRQQQQHQHQHQHLQANLQGSSEYGKQHNRLNNSGSINHNGYQYIHHNGSHHSQQNHQHHHHQQQQSSPHHHHHHQSPHRGAKAIFPSYHHGYPTGCDNNGNAVPYYYF